MKLSQQKCVPCDGSVPKMNTDEIQKHIEGLNGWKLQKSKIHKVFEFTDFISAMKFVNSIAEVAENEGHHPDIRIFSYKKVEIILWTHTIKGLSLNDFVLAAKISEIYQIDNA